MSANQQKGTRAAEAVARYLMDVGWPHAERRALHGNLDRGDITGVAGVCIQVKDDKSFRFGEWLVAVEHQRVNADAAQGLLVVKRRGFADPGQWYAIQTLRGAQILLKDAGY